MGIFDFFKKKKPAEELPTGDLVLDDLKVGYLVDFDMQTWEVTGYSYYDWGDGDISQEWQLKSAGDLIYLEKEVDDETLWSTSRKISFGSLGAAVRDHLLETGDPPEEIAYQAVTYYLEEQGGGHYYKNGQGPGQEFLQWSYEDENGQRFLTIEQWGEEEFEAAAGEPVEAYQFENILPRETQEP